MLSFWNYWGLVWRRIRADGFDWGRDQVILGFMVALIATVMEWREGEFNGKPLWPLIGQASIPYLSVAILYALSLILRGPWKLHDAVRAKLEDSEMKRVALERHSGPDIMLKIGSSKGTRQEALVFENTGNEPAYNVQLEEQTHDRVKAYAVSWIVPLIQAGSERSIDVVFWKRELHSEKMILMSLSEFFERESKEAIEFKVSFENAQRLPFVRTFIAKVPPFGEHVECFISGGREMTVRESTEMV